MLYGLGVLLIWLGLVSDAGLLGRVMLVVFGAGSLLLAERLRSATRAAVILTAQGLWDSEGREIAQLSNIRHVARGAFAAKPSGGFALDLIEARPRAYAPGLWWRAGRRVGVGGVTHSGAARFMAEQIAVMLQRQASR